MRTPWFLFGSAVILLVIMVAGFLTAPSVRPDARPHAVHTSIEVSDRGSQETLWLGYAMGLAILAVMTAVVLMGVGKNGRIGVLGKWLAAGFVCLGLIFTCLVASHGSYVAGNQGSFFGGLPAPTAWMIYGVWLFPILMILACSYNFDRWYFTEEDQRSIEELMRSTRTSEEDRK